MNPERVRWTDSRLDDKFETVVNELRVFRELPNTVRDLAYEVRNLKGSSEECAASQKALTKRFDAYVEEQRDTHEAHRLERKSDRRWMVGTVLAAAGLVISAVALLIGHIG